MASLTSGISRRDRLRSGTLDEIKVTARQLLIEQGPHSVTLRAIAREMGMTAPGLYRYFPSHQDLLTAVIADLYNELGAALEDARDALPAEDVEGRLITVSRGFRAWAMQHRPEFALIFGSPIAAADDAAADPKHESALRFAAVFVDCFFTLWLHRPFAVRSEESLDAPLAEQLRSYRETLVDQAGPAMAELPLGAIQRFIESWVQLYGAVALEALQHLHFCFTDAQPFFEAHMAEVAAGLGITAIPPPPE
jgi:AcrR family transcriptional regulator